MTVSERLTARGWLQTDGVWEHPVIYGLAFSELDAHAADIGLGAAARRCTEIAEARLALDQTLSSGYAAREIAEAIRCVLGLKV